MIILTSFMTIIFMLTAPSTKTPMKMISMLTILSMSVFMNVWLMTAGSWMPMIFLLMFVGGVMILFMMVSSVMPNEKSQMSKVYFKISMVMVLILSMFFKTNTEGSIMNLKWSLQTSHNTPMLYLLIVSYFFMFLYILESKMVSMNNQLCF